MKTIDSLLLGSMVLRRTFADELQLSTGVDISRPSSIRATLTERCNYKCNYCNHWRQEHYPEEMSLVEWQNALDSLKAFIGPYVVQFLGGEPFLWKGFFELVDYCYQNGIRWGVITNGSALNKNAIVKLVAANPLNIDISVDSLRPEIHDSIRGKENSVKQILNSLDMLIEERSRTSSQLVIRIKTTITRHNIPYLVEMVEWAKNFNGVTVDFNPVRYNDYLDIGIQNLYPKREEEFTLLAQVTEELIKLKLSGASIETSVEKLQLLVPHFREEDVIHGYSQCRVVLRNYHIHPNGNVSNCWSFGSIGNVKLATAKEIWQGSIRKMNIKPATNCNKLSTGECATSCTTHRTLKQEIQRGLLLVKKL